MSSEVAIDVRGVSKHYQLFASPARRLGNLLFGPRLAPARTFTALDNISFKVPRGQALGIIGRNGAGKSTLLQIICGTLTASAGQVAVAGRLTALLELGAGFNPEYTGRENVFTNGAIYGLSRGDVESILPRILAFAEIGAFVDQPVKTYSSGMFMRLAFSVIAHLEPDIMVIDEALAVGDVYFTQKCMRFLREFSRDHTLIFVSHDTHSVINLCQNALWLDHGRIAAYGSAREVCDAYLGSFFENRLEPGPDAVAENVPQRESGAGKESSAGVGEFGLGGARILSVSLLDELGRSLAVLDAPATLRLRVEFHTNETIEQPIVGFFVKDRIGQIICGDNSIKYMADRQPLPPDERFIAEFTFTLPQLATGAYTIGVAVGAGNQQQHVQHHWIHDALAFKSQADAALTGLWALHNLGVTLERMPGERD